MNPDSDWLADWLAGALSSITPIPTSDVCSSNGIEEPLGLNFLQINPKDDWLAEALSSMTPIPTSEVNTIEEPVDLNTIEGPISTSSPTFRPDLSHTHYFFSNIVQLLPNLYSRQGLMNITSSPTFTLVWASYSLLLLDIYYRMGLITQRLQ